MSNQDLARLIVLMLLALLVDLFLNAALLWALRRHRRLMREFRELLERLL